MKLYDQTGKEVLTIDASKEINRGGEGAIFQHPADKKLVVKVYHTGVKSSLNIAFAKELMKLGAEFIKPLELFYTKAGGIAGYSMKYLNVNKLFLLSTFNSKPTCQKEGFTEDFKKKVFENLTKSLEDAHKQGVVIGDLNPYNIFFSGKGEVFFIDTDSYQTMSKKHSGVLLPEVRDWTTHEINQSTDYYAFCVLAFQSLTYLHPYKGMHKKYKTLEERAVKRISVLSGDPDLTIPGFYQPVNNKIVENDFVEIFQKDKRFIINLNAIKATKVQSRPAAIINQKDLTIRLICTDTKDFECAGNFMCLNNETNKTLMYDVSKKQVALKLSELKTPNNTYCSSAGIFVDNYGSLEWYPKMSKITNVRYTSDDLVLQCGKQIVVFSDNTNSYMIYSMDHIMSGQAMSKISTIFVPSVVLCKGCAIQTVSGMKWLLDFELGFLQTIRTNYDIRNAAKSGDFYMLEIKEGNDFKNYLAKKNGLNIELGESFSSPRSITQVGENVLVTDDKKILVYSGLTLRKMAEIDCDVVTEQSTLSYCNAGIFCQTDSNLYLLNKN